MPARKRSKMFYRKSLENGYTSADLLKADEQATANERHIRAQKPRKMVQNTQPTKNGLHGWHNPTHRLFSINIPTGVFFSCPGANVESSTKTQLLVGKHS